MLIKSLSKIRGVANVETPIFSRTKNIDVVHRKAFAIFSAWPKGLRATPHTLPPSAPNNGSPAAHRTHDRATCAAAPAGKIAFLPLEKRLFFLGEHPKNADCSSAFAADIRGNPKK
jgi:hypothetical protein